MYFPPWIGGFTRDERFHNGAALPGGSGEVLLVVDTSGATTDTLTIMEPAVAAPRRGRMQFPLPYGDRVLRAFDERGFIWTATSHEYEIVKMTLSGDTVSTVGREIAAPSLTAVQRDSIRKYVRQLEGELGLTVQDAQIPSTAPLLRWFFVDDAGYLWVARASPANARSLDVFDPAARFLGVVPLPFTIDDGVIPVIRNGALYAVTEDALGVPSVLRARVVHDE